MAVNNEISLLQGLNRNWGEEIQIKLCVHSQDFFWSTDPKSTVGTVEQAKQRRSLWIFPVPYPQWRPITSMTKHLWWLDAVVTIAATASMILCNAVSVPIVISVPQKSLSIDPTIPTMFRWLFSSICSSVMSPENIYDKIWNKTSSIFLQQLETWQN